MTLNLCGLRLSSAFPDDLLPYMAGYLAGTFLIMMLEPLIAIRRYRSYLRRRDFLS